VSSLREGVRVGAWTLVSAAEAAEAADGRRRGRWLCRCVCGVRRVVFARELQGSAPRRPSCGAPACRTFGAVAQAMIDRSTTELADLLLGRGFAAGDVAEIVEQLERRQWQSLEAELRAEKNRRGVPSD